MDELNRILDSVTWMHSRSLELLSGLDEAGRALVGDIGRTASGITIHQSMAGDMDRAVAGLVEILSECDSTASDRETRSRDEILEDLAARYTMESEREIHESVLSGKSVLNQPVSPDQAEHPDITTTANDDSGNIELFDLPASNKAKKRMKMIWATMWNSSDDIPRAFWTAPSCRRFGPVEVPND